MQALCEQTDLASIHARLASIHARLASIHARLYLKYGNYMIISMFAHNLLVNRQQNSHKN